MEFDEIFNKTTKEYLLNDMEYNENFVTEIMDSVNFPLIIR